MASEVCTFPAGRRSGAIIRSRVLKIQTYLLAAISDDRDSCPSLSLLRPSVLSRTTPFHHSKFERCIWVTRRWIQSPEGKLALARNPSWIDREFANKQLEKLQLLHCIKMDYNCKYTVFNMFKQVSMLVEGTDGWTLEPEGERSLKEQADFWVSSGCFQQKGDHIICCPPI